MNVEQQLLIEQRVANEGKSQIVAYLLLIFLWGFGVHRMYLGRYVSGLFMLALWGVGWLTSWILIGWIPIAFVCVWVVIDMFLIPGMIQEDKTIIRQKLLTGTGWER